MEFSKAKKGIRKYLKKCLFSLEIRKMYMKTTEVSSYPNKGAKINKTANQFLKGFMEKRTLTYYWWDYKVTQSL